MRADVLELCADVLFGYLIVPNVMPAEIIIRPQPRKPLWQCDISFRLSY